jgi:hypothetical protein
LFHLNNLGVLSEGLGALQSDALPFASENEKETWHETDLNRMKEAA